MAPSSLFLLALALFAGAAQGRNDGARIVGGSVTSMETYPSVVQVESLNQGLFWLHQCGGSILNAIHVLSAAHCFSGRNFSPDERRIRAGTATRGSGGVIVHIAQVFNHPTFGSNGNDGDISVIRTSSAFIFTNTLNSRNFVAGTAVLPTGMLVNKVGWGSTAAQSSERAAELHDVTVPITDLETCRRSYASLTASPQVTNNMFCAGSSIADACEGDGGGPIFVSNIVVGVISWGNGCLVPGFPGVNTNVVPYSNWIVQVVSSA